ncbi:MAG TPA: hypothetical protein VJ302_03390 [Blastocatellia bacterium]|nr:hypothetical protein [Blastocatellia bacterium]
MMTCDPIIVCEWDADEFQRRVVEMELQGYVVRLESYRITPDMNPETGLIIHLQTIEMYRPGLDEAPRLNLSKG